MPLYRLRGCIICPREKNVIDMTFKRVRVPCLFDRSTKPNLRPAVAFFSRSKLRHLASSTRGIWKALLSKALNERDWRVTCTLAYVAARRFKSLESRRWSGRERVNHKSYKLLWQKNVCRGDNHTDRKPKFYSPRRQTPVVYSSVPCYQGDKDTWTIVPWGNY